MDSVPLRYEGTCVAFSANGKIMVTGDRSSLLIWDLQTALRPRQTSSEKLTDARFRELWADLESEDARVGHRAMVALVRRPGDAIAHIASRLPGLPPDEAAFGRLLRDLGADDFQTRESAYKAIAEMGDAAGARIREALKEPPSPEMKRRLTTLADKLKVTEGGSHSLGALCRTSRTDRFSRGTGRAAAAAELFRSGDCRRRNAVAGAAGDFVEIAVLELIPVPVIRVALATGSGREGNKVREPMPITTRGLTASSTAKSRTAAPAEPPSRASRPPRRVRISLVQPVPRRGSHTRSGETAGRSQEPAANAVSRHATQADRAGNP